MEGYSREHVAAVVKVIDQLISNELIRIRIGLRNEYGQYAQARRRGFARGPEPTEPRDAKWRRRDAARRRARHLKEENAQAAREIGRWMAGGVDPPA